MAGAAGLPVYGGGIVDTLDAAYPRNQPYRLVDAMRQSVMIERSAFFLNHFRK